MQAIESGISEDAVRGILTGLFETAVNAARPHFSEADIALCGDGPILVVGAGKAAASMACAFEAATQAPLRGAVITRHGYVQPAEKIRIVEGTHPFPTQQNIAATAELITLLKSRRPDEHVVALISGGGSSLLCAPIEGVSLHDKISISRALMDAGADIREINLVRRHLSMVKGGGLARLCPAGRLTTFAISDVVGDVPGDIASGPTIYSPPDVERALATLDRHGVKIESRIQKAMRAYAAGIAPADFSANRFRYIATPERSMDAAAKQAQRLGIEVINLGADLTGEARDLGKAHAIQARALKAARGEAQPPLMLLSGGEVTVTRTGEGQGGPNTEYLAGMLNELAGAAGIFAVAGDTDGIDGAGDNAGAVVTPSSWLRAGPEAIRRALDHNDCYGLFRDLGDLLMTGPTLTNVNDIRMVMVVQP